MYVQHSWDGSVGPRGHTISIEDGVHEKGWEGTDTESL